MGGQEYCPFGTEVLLKISKRSAGSHSTRCP
jgi:hypothetical protein